MITIEFPHGSSRLKIWSLSLLKCIYEDETGQGVFCNRCYRDLDTETPND